MANACGCGCGHATREVKTLAPARYAGHEQVGDVARNPGARAVLERFGVNHCCGAGLSLRESAAAAGAELPALLSALEKAASPVA
jgi:iron-sulfur cluster repair protein YtfE (RIC family)